MMKLKHWPVLLAAMVAFASPAQAIVFPDSEAISAQLAATRFSGVGRLGDWSGPGTIKGQCTGSLIAQNVVITASHCFPGRGSFNFVLGEGGNEVGFGVSSWKGFDDLALVTLDRSVGTGYDIYGIYDRNDEIGQTFTMVGAGMVGLLSTGVTDDGRYPADNRLRFGTNTYDLTRADYDYAFQSRDNPDLPRPTGVSNILFFDNDDGNPDHDVFGRYVNTPGLGVMEDGKLIETGISYGDSGGPDFIGNLIAGIHTFGFTGAQWNGGDDRCGPGSVDPVAPHGWMGCNDDSAGDIGASMRVSFYKDDIRAYLADVAAAGVGISSAPEPGTWAMMMIGMMSVGVALRRQRPSHRRLALA